jgi:hypothetical protein
MTGLFFYLSNWKRCQWHRVLESKPFSPIFERFHARNGKRVLTL